MAGHEHGTLVKWNDAGGYGFIKALDSDLPDLFFHVRDFKGSGGRPDIGERLQYTPKRQADGRWRALGVRRPLSDEYKQALREKDRLLRLASPTTWLPALLVAGFIGFLAWAESRHLVPRAGYWFLATMNLLTFVAYARDKRSAGRLGQRTPETTLHMMELLGGWLGAWAAQTVLRHKTRKPAFLWTYLLMGSISFALFAAWVVYGKSA